MPLQPIPVSTNSAAEDAARNLVNLVTQTAQRVVATRKNGIAAVPERAPKQMPNGQVMPGAAARPAVSGADIDAALTSENVAVFDALAGALGLTTPVSE